MQTELLTSAINKYIAHQNDNQLTAQNNRDERSERLRFYQSFDKTKITKMTQKDFMVFIGNLWSMKMWTNKDYRVNEIIKNNTLDHLKEHLIKLLYGTDSINKRWDYFLENVKGIGPSTISELLCYINPQEYVIFNQTTVKCLAYLGVENLPNHNYQYNGERYQNICQIAKNIAAQMEDSGLNQVSLLEVDYMLWDEILPLTQKIQKPIPIKSAKSIKPKSLHHDIRDKIVKIGEMQGFICQAEVKVAPGCKVDAVWETPQSKVGKIVYVFEVQCSGSIKNMLINLEYSLNNPAVQGIYAVANKSKFKEIFDLCPNQIMKSRIRFIDIDEIETLYQNLYSAHAILDKFELNSDGFI